MFIWWQRNSTNYLKENGKTWIKNGTSKMSMRKVRLEWLKKLREKVVMVHNPGIKIPLPKAPRHPNTKEFTRLVHWQQEMLK